MDEHHEPSTGSGVTTPLDWILSRPDVTSRLRREPPDRVLVLRCRDGSEVERLATAFPNVTIYGIDDDPDLLDQAVARLGRSSVRDRVLCQRGSVLRPRISMTFDVVVAAGLAMSDERDPTTTADFLQMLAGLLGHEGLAILDSPRQISADDANAAGFYRVETLGPSGQDRTAFLLRR
jgi:hypothetical protein